MIKAQIASSKNSGPYIFCPKENYYKNENMTINKYNNVWISCFYSVLSETLSYIIYINKNITKAQPRFRGQVEVNQPCYYTSILMITRTKSQKLVWQSFKHNGTCKIKYY